MFSLGFTVHWPSARIDTVSPAWMKSLASFNGTLAWTATVVFVLSPAVSTTVAEREPTRRRHVKSQVRFLMTGSLVFSSSAVSLNPVPGAERE
jgi:hypothetical protein